MITGGEVYSKPPRTHETYVHDLQFGGKTVRVGVAVCAEILMNLTERVDILAHPSASTFESLAEDFLMDTGQELLESLAGKCIVVAHADYQHSDVYHVNGTRLGRFGSIESPAGPIKFKYTTLATILHARTL